MNRFAKMMIYFISLSLWTSAIFAADPDQIFQATFKVPKSSRDNLSAVVEAQVKKQFGANFTPLRYFIGDVQGSTLIVEAVVTNVASPQSPAPVQTETQKQGDKASVVVSLIPTGIQAAFGGWAGDATPITKLLAKSAPIVVTNPNAVNASNFIEIPDNVVYSEGSQIDSFMQGKIKLDASQPTRVGVIVEKTSAQNFNLVLNLVNTAKMLAGVDIVDVIMTTEAIGSQVQRTASGAYVGTIARPDVLLNAAKSLKARGATAIAVTTLIGGYDEALYLQHFSGNHPNPIGGVETIISHLLVSELGIPAAHGPLVNYKPSNTPSYIDPRGTAEFVSECGLYCVLRGLSQAPQMNPNTEQAPGLAVSDVIVVVAPADALGGIPVLEANRRNIPVIGIKSNQTILDVTAEKLGLQNALVVDTYTQAAGAIDLLRAGQTSFADLKKNDLI